MDELAPYIRGWRNYFGFCQTPEVLISLTSWVRRKLRCALWRQWKTVRRRRAALLQLGVRPWTSLRSPLHARADQPVLHHPRIQECPDKFQQPLVLDPLRDLRHQFVVVDSIEGHHHTLPIIGTSRNE
jgi:hypothetical protein